MPVPQSTRVSFITRYASYLGKLTAALEELRKLKAEYDDLGYSVDIVDADLVAASKTDRTAAELTAAIAAATAVLAEYDTGTYAEDILVIAR